MRRLALLAALALWLAPDALADDVLVLERDAVLGPSARALRGVDFPFTLPPGAKQGPRTWYLVRLHFRVVVSPLSRNGSIYVYGYTNGQACAQIRIDTRRTADGLRVHVSELGLVAGARETTSAKLEYETTFRNFLLFGGVRGGRNVLTVQAAQRGGARLASLRVFAGSGIERSPHGPASISLEPFLDRDTAQVGRSFDVRFRVRNPSARAAAGGVVTAEPGPGMTVLSRKSVRFAAVPPNGSVEGSFELEAATTGRHELRLAAESVSGSPEARLAIRVEQAGRPVWQGIALALGIAAAALAALGVALRRHAPVVLAGAVIFVAATIVYTSISSTAAAFVVLLVGAVVAGFAVGSWWAVALPLLWPVLALIGEDEDMPAWIVALLLSPLGAGPIAAGVALRQALRRQR